MNHLHVLHILERVETLQITSQLANQDLMALVKLTNIHYNQVYEDEGKGAKRLITLKKRLNELYAEILRRIEDRPGQRATSGLILSLYDWIYGRSDWSGRDKERMNQFVNLTRAQLENTRNRTLTDMQCLQHGISIYALQTKEERSVLEEQIDQTFRKWMQTHVWGKGWQGCTTEEILNRLQIRLNTTAFRVSRDWDYEFTDVMESCITQINPEMLTNETLILYYDVAVGMEEWYLPLKSDVATTTTIIIETLKQRMAVNPDLQLLSRVADWQFWQEKLFV